ncbi:MAG TPA: hypothetical protein VGJ33_18725 [Candidatus Angelobacter sp.]
MSRKNGKSATRLYEIFSQYKVHGGTISSLAGMALAPAQIRVLSTIDQSTRLLGTCRCSSPFWRSRLSSSWTWSVVMVREQAGQQVGACVLVWLDRAEPRWLEGLQLIRRDFGLVS